MVRQRDDDRYDAVYRAAEAEHRASSWEVIERDQAYELKQLNLEEQTKYDAAREAYEAREAKWWPKSKLRKELCSGSARRPVRSLPA